MLNLPITPNNFLLQVVHPALALMPQEMNSRKAIVLLITIAQQESGLAHRWQIVDNKNPNNKGPARGLFQFERGGGVKGVYQHESTADLLLGVCNARNCAFDVATIWERLETDDLLACCVARLLLWSDPQPLPTDADGAWDLYARTWRPGRPHRETWNSYYRQSVDALEAACTR